MVADGTGPSEAPPGVTVIRTGGTLAGQGVPPVRNYLYALCRLIGRALRLPRHDVVVTMTDPPLLAVAGPLLAARYGAASIHWSHDLYPALLPVVGARLPGPLMRMVEYATEKALRRHDAVVAIGRCMARRITAIGVPPERLAVLPNWPDSRIHPVERASNPFRVEHGLGDRFTVTYSGNLGLAHPMAGVLDAAETLGRTDPDIVFLLIGDGRGHRAVADAVKERGLRNVRFLPFQPPERLAESLSAADLHLATMEPRAEGLLVPSKVAGALAAGRPCLFLGPAGSEAAALVDGCGLALDPLDGAEIAAAIRNYARNSARCAEEGRRALAVTAGWNADIAARRFAALAEAVRKPASLVRVPKRGLPHA
ncbi:glycosyltransferase involved in cell wall biosynthesis [Azospirillum soli]|nr:glycosyltransferase involved in cell wall biosynthesis [Azospirillum soli]